MKTLLIVFHSLTGGTRQMAEAAGHGAHQAVGQGTACPVNIRLQSADDTGPDDLLCADGYLFATPENLAAMAGRMKDFFDRTYYPVLDRLNGRPYAVMVCAGSDGANTVRQLVRIATGWRLRPIADPIIIHTNAQNPQTILAPKIIPPDALRRCRELGAGLAAGLEAGIF